MRRASWFAIFLALAGAPVAAEESLVVVREEAGYRLSRPDAQWIVRHGAVPPTAHDALRIEREPAPAEVTLTVYTADVPSGATADGLIEIAAAGWAPKADGPVVPGTSTVAGEAAPTIAWNMRLAGASLHVRQHFVVHAGDLFVIQCVAPPSKFAEYESSFESALASFTLLPPDASRGDARSLRLLAARCGKDVPRARTWAEASARAAREHRLVLVVVEQFRGLPIPPLADSTTFMDDDVVGLCRTRLVVLPWSDATKAPFTDPKAYGLGPHTFGQGALFVTPAGKVVGSIGLIEPSLLDEQARAVLAAAPDATGLRADEDDPAIALERGELERADALLTSPKSAVEWRLRADLLRRRHQADDALAALDKAREAGGDAPTLKAERGLMLLRAGRVDEAIEALEAAGKVPAARYWLAVAGALRRGVSTVQADLIALVRDERSSPIACRAAAFALGRGVATGMEAVYWPDAAVREAATARPYSTGPRVDLTKARSDAIAYLLRTQRPDGTWALPMAFAPDPRGPTTAAVASIAGSALLRHRDRAGVDAAVNRAEEAATRSVDRMKRGGAGTFDYSVWAQIFSLRFLSAFAKDAPPREASRLRTVRFEIADAMERGRAPGGGWSYVDLSEAGLSSDNSISFVTAAALLSLSDARDAGPSGDATAPTSIARSASILSTLRRADGSFAYQTTASTIEDSTEAALRGPLCCLAMRRASKQLKGSPLAIKAPTDDELRASLAALVTHLPDALREAGKPLCHTAPDGTSAYYLLFGLRYAAEALRDLPEKDRATLRPALVDAVMRLRRDDGSFCDFMPVGPAYGTAMALEALDLLE